MMVDFFKNEPVDLEPNEKFDYNNSASQPMIGQVFVDKFVFDGKEDLKQGRNNDSKKKKLIIAVETNDIGGIKRVYFDNEKKSCHFHDSF